MKQILYLNVAGILCALLFGVVFTSFQNEKIYNNTLGLISKNYESNGAYPDNKIKKVKKPYLNTDNNHFLQWDASIYYTISERMYASESVHYGNVRAAFFPMFPLFWRMTQLSPRMISIFNYLIFLLSLSLLVKYILACSEFIKLVSYLVLVTLPTSVIYMIPYSESLFLLFMTITSIGILKKNYPLYFIGVVLMSMVRPATLFIMLALLSTDLVFHLKNKQKSLLSLIKSLIATLAPFIIGYGLVFSIQYASSGSWTAFWDAQKYWEGGIQKIHTISDWSIEGFGLNVFSIFFIAIPALAYLLYLTSPLVLKKEIHFKMNEEKSYLLVVSLFYLAGIFVFTILSSGGNIHGFFRFTMCSPCFYIALLILISNLPRVSPLLSNMAFAFMFMSLCLFLANVEYGGNRFQFPYLGLLLLMITFLYLLNRRFIGKKLNFAFLLLLIICNTIWNTYMLNVFLSNGWVFT